MFNGERQNFAHGLMDSRDARFAQARGHRQRMNSGGVKNLVGVNVTDAGDEGLVQQQRFQPRLALPQSLGELLQADFKRLRT